MYPTTRSSLQGPRVPKVNPKPQTPNPKPQTPNPKPQTPNSFAAPTHDIDPDRAKSLAREKRKETYGEALVQPLKLQPEFGGIEDWVVVGWVDV